MAPFENCEAAALSRPLSPHLDDATSDGTEVSHESRNRQSQNNGCVWALVRLICRPCACVCSVVGRWAAPASYWRSNDMDDPLLETRSLPQEQSSVERPSHKLRPERLPTMPQPRAPKAREFPPLAPATADELEMLPGSDLQAAIAMSLQAAGLGAPPEAPECVICLEEFDGLHPRLPTLCQCGLSRAAFHAGCLRAWVAKQGVSECPTCNTELFWEEPSPVPAEPTMPLAELV
jgi:hypothetical protein